MKKLNLFTVILLCLVVNVTTISCSNDDDTTAEDPQVEDPTSNYFPLALNNTWNYDFTGGDDLVIDLYSTLTHNGNTFYITDFINPVDGGDMIQGYRVDGSTYYGYNGETTIDYDYSGFSTTATIDPAEFVFFNDTMEVNESITTTVAAPTEISALGISVDTTTNFEFIATVVGKDLEMTVNGEMYTDVIKVYLVVNADISGSIVTEELYYYFANNVGPIQLESSLGDYTLLTYTLN
ncbi:hypothetical protein NBRC110019_06830 [Neptunitalea chrysea]|uniref:Uncharacterized protein n=1 Tax=Neptunitalea chrysea TaxID=1647581 RepID=A0A9W6B5G2_9FLAO|nr:hypothetical protein [Neptunitalea chrysea]GLB51644.1 hypothetical protein NBRC110019_06830 [Neptunitalea chrysea]